MTTRARSSQKQPQILRVARVLTVGNTCVFGVRGGWWAIQLPLNNFRVDGDSTGTNAAWAWGGPYILVLAVLRCYAHVLLDYVVSTRTRAIVVANGPGDACCSPGTMNYFWLAIQVLIR